MSTNSTIEWTEATWSPVTGCTRVSEGCRFCYAERLTATRLAHLPKYKGLAVLSADGEARWTGQVRLNDDVLDEPLHWRKPRRVFVNSMSDLFHKDVPFEFIDKMFAVMALCPQHTFQILTKRPEIAAEYEADMDGAMQSWYRAAQRFMDIDDFPEHLGDWDWTMDRPGPLDNVWLGTSVENQEQADKRIPHLLKCPAAVRFLSVEPLLGPVNIPHFLGLECRHEGAYSEPDTNATVCRECEETPTIDWVIVGGESGPGARPMHPDWARSIRDQCAAAGVPFFFKQWGAWEPVTPLYDGRDDAAENGRGELEMVDTRGHIWDPDQDGQPNDMRTWQMELVGKHAAGRLLDGREHNDMPNTRSLAGATV